MPAWYGFTNPSIAGKVSHFRRKNWSMSFLVALLVCLSLKPVFCALIIEGRDVPVVVSNYKNFAVDGCFTPTTLSFQFSTSTNATVESCIDMCSAANYIRAGLVAGSQCWCGNVIKPGNSGVGDSLCSTACTGNASEVCGGPNSMLEYSVRPPVVPQVVGSDGIWNGMDERDAICVPDVPSARTLHHLQERSDSMTVQRCLDACLAQDFALAGLEYGSECWCGNADMYGRRRITPASSACNFPCAGNPAQICGGANALNIYDRRSGKGPTVGPPSPFTSPYNNTWFFNACVRDDAVLSGGPRTLPHPPTNPIGTEDMTPFLCIDRCAADGWKVAGIEYGQECWCGSPLVPLPTSLLAPLNDCNLPCTDYADFSCGGPNRLLTYYRR
ncbi:hypothetical protein K443DRAFT_9163 [Laccaria amethystina LaAM-08-1]|uniref:WSC domain-containing protein n=1 Tax=Laccaria amethystina LaAM-08-1 TaxID=1095629 RepID=A0A0C9WZX1_9AGAR|nr:hypothetical protein K443DRAFT_9163 [Laccaria amethystina LaAM-08-1]